MKIGFDNAKYLQMQSQHIRERIAQFDNKLYLEFGGKLFDDYHASRVLPGFEPDSKLQMLLQLKEQAEIVIVISAQDIISSKVRGDYGITYDLDVLRLIDAFQGMGLFVGSVCVTMYTAAPEVEAFEHKLNSVGVRTFRHYKIPGYPNDVARIVSDEGYGKNDYIETQRPLVVITAPGPGSGKMATCLSQLYHEHKRGIKAGYAKFETFPIWNLPLKHPVNLAYEAATADLNDVNMIDPFHLEAYGVTTVNYNRDIEIFPVVNAMFELHRGQEPLQVPHRHGREHGRQLHRGRRGLPRGLPQRDHPPLLQGPLRPEDRQERGQRAVQAGAAAESGRSGRRRPRRWRSRPMPWPSAPTAHPPPPSSCRTAPSSPARPVPCWARPPLPS